MPLSYFIWNFSHAQISVFEQCGKCTYKPLKSDAQVYCLGFSFLIWSWIVTKATEAVSVSMKGQNFLLGDTFDDDDDEWGSK